MIINAIEFMTSDCQVNDAELQLQLIQLTDGHHLNSFSISSIKTQNCVFFPNRGQLQTTFQTVDIRPLRARDWMAVSH